MRPPLFLALVLSTGLFSLAVSAKDFRLPVDKPVASVNLSDDWRPEETPRGLRAQTKDAAVNLTIAATTDPKEMAAIIDDADARLKARKTKLDRATHQEHKIKINGFPAEEIVYQGRDDAGPIVVTFTFVTVRDAVLVFTYWATHEGDQEHQAELGIIFDSIKALKLADTAAPMPAAAASAKP